MSRLPIHIYVGLVAGGAVASLAIQDWSKIPELPSEVLVGYGVLVLLGLVSQGTAVRLSLGRGTSTSTTTGSTLLLPLIACVLLFGATLTVFFCAVSYVFSNFILSRKALIKGVFNVSQSIVCAAVAGLAFEAVGGQALAILAAESPGAEFKPQLLGFLAFTLVCLPLNNAFVFLAIAASSSVPGKRTFLKLVRGYRSAFFLDLLISPLGILIAFLYFELGVIGLAISILPLLFVRHSYLSKNQLEEANQDLLRALVKAIETRDPYTSGHSLRVQSLSEEIGGAMGLRPKQLDELQTAALLHDIGKIEIVYEEILSKAGPLTVRERDVIRSHVTRGVEILSSLSSFRGPIVSAVRHHHEAYDGSGYPEGLKGDDIPLYARIIQISDSIDAMLSDRPYRRALTVEAVRDELRRFRDVQFDGRLVECVLENGLVARHASRMRSERGASDPLSMRTGVSRYPEASSERRRASGASG